MFTIITVFICLLIFPILMGPSIGFHHVNENHRWQSSPAEDEGLGVKIGLGIIGFLAYIGAFGSLLVTIIVIVAVLYVFKIGESLKEDKPIYVLGSLLLKTKLSKISFMSFVIVIFLAVLENMHIIPTYIR